MVVNFLQNLTAQLMRIASSEQVVHRVTECNSQKRIYIIYKKTAGNTRQHDFNTRQSLDVSRVCRNRMFSSLSKIMAKDRFS